jgi:hypothetical protein
LPHGVATWLRYTLAAEKYTRGQKRSFVSFEMLLADWRRELGRIGHQLDIRWPRLETSLQEIDLFLGANHRNPGPAALSDDGAHRSISIVYDGLNQAVTDPQTTPAAFEMAAETTAVAEDVLGAYALIKEHQVAELREEIANVHRALASEIGARDSRIAEATIYARSLEQSRDEALRYAKAQELRVAELTRSQAVVCENAAGSRDNLGESH